MLYFCVIIVMCIIMCARAQSCSVTIHDEERCNGTTKPLKTLIPDGRRFTRDECNLVGAKLARDWLDGKARLLYEQVYVCCHSTADDTQTTYGFWMQRRDGSIKPEL